MAEAKDAAVVASTTQQEIAELDCAQLAAFFPERVRLYQTHGARLAAKCHDAWGPAVRPPRCWPEPRSATNCSGYSRWQCSWAS